MEDEEETLVQVTEAEVSEQVENGEAEQVMNGELFDSNENNRLRELNIRKQKQELEERKQVAKEKELENKKRKAFEKKIKIIFDHLDDQFTFKSLSSFERKIIHELVTRTNYIKTLNDKLIISRAPLDQIETLTQELANVEMVERRYNLRKKVAKK